MSNSNGIITAPVSLDSDIPVVLGLSSYDVGTLIGKARAGGKAGVGIWVGTTYAFNTLEVGMSSGDGTLIDGAKPYWNIFSNESPGEFVATPTHDGALIFKLKDLIKENASLGYGYSVDAFAGYNHSAVGPENNDTTIDVPVGSSKNINLAAKYNTGDYDWRKISGVDSGRFELTSPSGVSTVSPMVSINNTHVQLIANVPIYLANTSDPHTEKYILKMYVGRNLGANDFDAFGYIPILSNVVFNIYAEIRAVRLKVFVGVSSGFFTIDPDYTTNANNYTFYGTKKTSVDLSSYALKSIKYSIVNGDGTAGGTVTKTGIFDSSNESPLTFEYMENNTVSFVVSRNRLATNGSYPYLEVEMRYST